MDRVRIAASIAVLAGSLLTPCSSAQDYTAYSLVKLDPALTDLVPDKPMLEVVAGGFDFTEGITYVPTGPSGTLYFTDIPANRIYKLDLATRRVETFATQAGYTGEFTGIAAESIGTLRDNELSPTNPRYRKFTLMGANGLVIGPDGRLVVCTFGGRSVTRYNADGSRETVADRWDGKRFDGPNDIVVGRDGSLYFTDTDTAMRDADTDKLREMTSMGVYRIQNGKVTRLLDGLVFPNGIAFSPDGKILYVNNTRKRFDISRYHVLPDGTLDKQGEPIIDFQAEQAKSGGPLPGRGTADGMKVDVNGNLWATGPDGIWILSPTGKPLGRIKTPETVENLVFGGPDMRTLYLAARTTIYSMRVSIAGARTGVPHS